MKVLTRYLLDTGVAGAYLRQEPEIRRRLKGGVFAVSVIVVGELYHGAFNSNTRAANLQALRVALESWTLRTTLLLCNAITAERFGLIATDLQQRGLTVPDNDIWIAAQTMQYNLTVLGRGKALALKRGMKALVLRSLVLRSRLSFVGMLNTRALRGVATSVACSLTTECRALRWEVHLVKHSTHTKLPASISAVAE